MAQLILASASPRRKELLDQIGVSYIVHAVDIDETPLPLEQPQAYVQRIAAAKSDVCLALRNDNLPVLAADTTVVLGQTIMGKPKNQDDAVNMLGQLSGSTHQVYTAVSLRGREHWQVLNITEVTFKTLAIEEILAYWQTGEPQDKAGSYAIQGLGAVFVEQIKGSFSRVVGLPLFETSQLLLKQGIHPIHERRNPN